MRAKAKNFLNDIFFLFLNRHSLLMIPTGLSVFHFAFIYPFMSLLSYLHVSFFFLLDSSSSFSIFVSFKATICNKHLSYYVDVRTQAMYQLLDSGFIGLIFSCYSEDANKVCLEQMISVRHRVFYAHQD